MFTKDITTNEITFTKDYQDLLASRLENDADYDIKAYETYYHILTTSWTIFDIKDWLETLDNYDYAVSIFLVSKDSTGIFTILPRIVISKEFMVNNQSNANVISTYLSNTLKTVFERFGWEDNHYILIQYTKLDIL